MPCLGGPRIGLKNPKGPTASLRAYQRNSFNNFYNSFFIILRPKNVCRRVGACKTWEQIL